MSRFRIRRSALAALAWVSLAAATPVPPQTPEPAASSRQLLAEDHDAPAAPGAAPLAPGSTPAETGYPYVFELKGVDGDLAERLTALSVLAGKLETPPTSQAALDRRIEGDLERFAAALKAEGYYAYALNQKIDRAAEPIAIAITATPGPVYRLASFRVDYRAPDAPGLVKDVSRLGVTVGGPARSAPVAEAPPKLLRLLGEAGYPMAKLADRSAVVDHAAQEMRVTLKIDEGPRAVFGETRVIGLDRVEAAYVIRVAALKPGEIFDVAKIDEARRRLFETDLFEALQLERAEAPDAQGRLDVVIKAQERERRTISFGLNFSTTDGFGSDVEWRHRNFFGEDEDLTLTFRLAELEQSARAELAAPNYLRLNQRAFVAFEGSRQDLDAFEEQRAQAEIGASRTYGRWRFGAAGELAYVETDEDDDIETTVELGLPLTAAFDGTNNLFDPSKGFKLNFQVEPTAITVEETAVLATLIGGGSVYYALAGRDLIAAARGRAGVILGPDIADIPAGRRLFAGGGGSIRGYEFQTVSPLDGAGDPDGGRSLVEFGVELRWRVTEDFGVVPFLDGGGAYADAIPDFKGTQYAAGLGLRYYTPIGPLRLDVAAPLNPRDRDNLFEFYISLGQAF